MAWFKKTRQNESEEKPELWNICPSCKAHVFKEEWAADLKVCPKCNYHDRLNYQERLDLILDEGSFREINSEVTTNDPINFVDAKGSYADKVAAAKKKTNMNEAVVTGCGNINDIPVVVAVMDFRFMGGSLGSGTGEKILLAAEYALRNKRPYIIFSASGGARMHEGIISLMQMAKTCAAIARLNKAGIPYISVLTHPTTGGVSASFATIGDINISEPGALIGFAGRRVIEETIKQKLPDDFQTAEYLLEHGFLDKIVARKDMKEFFAQFLPYAIKSPKRRR